MIAQAAPCLAPAPRQTIAPDVADATVDLRCPQPVTRNGYCHPGKLLAKLRLSGGVPSFVHPDNVIEMPCEECRYRLRKEGRPVRKVLHRYDLLGECVATLVDEDGS